MRLKPAHRGAFEENVSTICTDRLYREALESLKVAPLPTMSVWITRRVFRERRFWDSSWVEDNKRTLWQVLTGVKKQPRQYYMSHPKEWELPYGGGFGRKDRKLVVRLQVKWKVDGEDNDRYSYDHTEEGPMYGDEKLRFFTTDIEIFPLTSQQAAFVGAKCLTSAASSIFWGTREDVMEIQTKFAIA